MPGALRHFWGDIAFLFLIVFESIVEYRSRSHVRLCRAVRVTYSYSPGRCAVRAVPLFASMHR